tara:strand:+ start:8339 stop:8857 length:519 start_codon:yes stop_codon:yes gene_type:complete
MATHTEGWGCDKCSGYGHITFDTRPMEGVPPVYGACERCGYTFGCGEYDDFTHPDSYEYLETLHDMNQQRYWKMVELEEEGEDEVDIKPYTKEEYREIIDDAGTDFLIGIKTWKQTPNRHHNQERSEEDFFSDEWCRTYPHNKDLWCDYCLSKEPLYVSPFINWIINPLEEK